MSLTNKTLKNNFSSKLNLEEYSRGMGGIGLPGDLSSSSRFIRGSFFKLNSENISIDNELAQFFHIADTVKQIRGCCRIGDKLEYTRYISCMESKSGIYHYRTYDSFETKSIDMHRVNLNSDKLCLFGY
jgi:choloylglycine hydrolase